MQKKTIVKITFLFISIFLFFYSFSKKSDFLLGITTILTLLFISILAIRIMLFLFKTIALKDKKILVKRIKNVFFILGKKNIIKTKKRVYKIFKFKRTKAKTKTKTIKRKKNEIILPLYFGWEIAIRRVSDLRKHIVGPFKYYWQFITVVFLLIALTSTTIFLNKNNPTNAATYTFTQSSWTGGADTGTTANHTSNQSDWTKYYSKSSGITAGTDITITPTTASTTIDFTTEGSYTQEDSDNTDITGGVGKLESSYSGVYPPAYNDTYVKATSDYTWTYPAYASTDPNLSLTGEWADYYAQWLCGLDILTNQRFHIDLGSAKNISRIYYENAHTIGTVTGAGAKNFTLWGSNTSSGVFDDLVYANDEGWTQITGLSQTQFDQHVALDQVDPKYITITGNEASYRYYALKIADNWGGGARYIGIRHIELQAEVYSTTPYYISTTDTTQVDVSTYASITDVDLTQITPTDTDIKYLVSFDDRFTWKYWTGSAWTSSSLANLQTQGMSKTIVEGLSSANWSASGGFTAGTTSTLDFAMDLSTSDSSATPEIDQIKVNYTYLNTVSNIDFTTEGNYVQEDSTYTDISDGVGKLGASYTPNYPPAYSDTYVKATIFSSSSFAPYLATNPTLSLIGNWASTNSWSTSFLQISNQRFHIDLGSSKNIARIYYENTHESGSNTNHGARNFTLWGSNTSSGVFDDLVYTNDTGWTQITGLSQTEFDQHSAFNEADPKYIDISGNSASYQYYALKIANNWGSAAYMALRHIELQSGEYSTTPYYITSTSTSQIDITGWSGIKELATTQTTPTDTDIKYLVSFDDKATWNYWTGSAWTEASMVSGYTSDLCTSGTASASTFLADTYNASKPFDNNGGTYWNSTGTGAPEWIKYDFGVGNEKTITKYTTTPIAGDYAWKDFIFQGSNDDSDWVDLDTNVGLSSFVGIREFTFSNTNSYRYYRFYITDDNNIANDVTLVNEIEMMESFIATGLPAFQEDGMSKTTLETLTQAQWSASGGFIPGTTTSLDFAMDLSTTDSGATPELDQIAVTPEQGLISSKYNTEVSVNVMGGINWTEDSTLPVSSQVSMYLRTASSAIGLDSASWTEVASSTPGFLTSGCSKVSSSITCTEAIIPSAMKDGSGDQWIQYKVVIDPGVASPTVDNISPVYVANGPPDINTFTATQGSDGLVNISYEIKDIDTTGGSATANYITPTFEYYNGSSWNSIATSSITFGSAPTNGGVTDINSDGDIDNKVLEDSYLIYTATWLASTTIADLYTSGFQLRMTADDNEAANNTISSTTIASILDTSPPSSPSILIDASVDPAQLTVSATDDSSMEMRISLNSNFNGSSWVSYATNPTITLDTVPDMVYIEFKDAYGNMASANVSSPATPDNPIVQDISNVTVSPSRYALYSIWGVVDNPGPGFGSYKVYHSTDGISYSLESTITDRNINYYADQGLLAGTPHYYKAVTVDALGNVSTYSTAKRGVANGVQDGTEGGGGVETSAPTISAVTTSAIGTQSATITWETDELGDSRVEYISATGGDFSSAPYVGKTSMLNTSSGIGEHSITLSGLSPDTSYYYKVKSTDINSNTASSTLDVNGYTFDTLAGVTISDVATDNIENTNATVTWTTNTDDNSYVVYSINSDLSNSTQTGSAVDTSAHSVSLSGLSTGTKYYFYVQSGVATDKNVIDGDINYYDLTTTQDTIAPVITFATSTDITSITDTTANVSWTTSELATSTLEYGVTVSYGSITENSNYNTNHSFDLSSLTPGTTYHIRLKSVDTNNNIRTSSDYTFNTTDSSDITAPTIDSGPTVSPIYDTAAVITWTTSESATSTVGYGTSTGVYTLSATNTNLNTSQSITLSSLTASTTYYYLVSSQDGSYNTVNSSEGTFTTLEALTEESDIVAREEVARQAGIDSVSTTPVVGSTYCGSNTTWDGSQCTASGGGGGVLIVEKLVDSSGEEVKADITAPIISNINISNITSDSAVITWSTNESANSFVEYGFSSIYDDIVGEFDNVNSHQATVKYLIPGTIYNYRTVSTDSSGNLSYSGNLTFATLSLDEELENIENGNDQSVKGETVEEKNTYLPPMLSNNPSPPTQEEKEEAESILKVAASAARKAMSIIKNTISRVSISSLENTLMVQQSSIEELARSIPSPIMSGEPNVLLTAKSATIAWTTDKESNSLIGLSPDINYDSSAQSYQEIIGDPDSLTRDHRVSLFGLEPDTEYHYQLRNKASVGPIAISNDFTFTTDKEVLEITNYAVANVSTEEAIFKWATNTESDSTVIYTPYRNNVLSIEESITKNSKAFTTIHEQEIDNFESGVSYEVELISKDDSDNIATRKITNFTTSEDDLAPIIYQVQTKSAISPGKDVRIQTIISWKTNESATTRIYYQKGIAGTDVELAETTKLDNNYSKEHIVVLTKFDPGTVYTFKAESVDSGGNVSVSKPYTILTPRQTESVFQVIMKNMENVFGWVGKIRK